MGLIVLVRGGMIYCGGYIW